MAMIRPRTDGPDLIQNKIQKLLLDLANEPIEVPTLLHAVANLLELAAIQIRHVENGGRRVVWDVDQRQAYRLRASLENWVQGIRFTDWGRDLEQEDANLSERERGEPSAPSHRRWSPNGRSGESAKVHE